MIPRPAARLVVPLVFAVATAGLAACDDVGAGGDAPVLPAASPRPTPGDPVVHRTEVPPLHPSVDDYASTVVDVVATDGTTHRIAVLVARTPAQRVHGLKEVPDVPDGVGMLFVGYDEDRTGGFWMKDTLVPLTIAYLAADGSIVDLVDMEPCEDADCPSYPPDEPYRAALEMRQGWFAEHGITEGAVVYRADRR